MEGGNSNGRTRKITSGLSTAELFLGVKEADRNSNFSLGTTQPILTNGNGGGIELDETDVVWAENLEEEEMKNQDGKLNMTASSPPPPSSADNGFEKRKPRRGVEHATSGLSAALDEDYRRGLSRFALQRNINTYNNSNNGSYPKSSAAFTNFGQSSTAGIGIPAPPIKSSEESYLGSARKYHQSAPVNVPMWTKNNTSRANHTPKPNHMVLEEMVDEDDDEEKDEERLPPHEILARDYAKSHMTTFSVYEGLGRTLRGRDLRRVRNAVLRKTEQKKI